MNHSATSQRTLLKAQAYQSSSSSSSETPAKSRTRTSRYRRLVFIFVVAAGLAAPNLRAADDILIADFEGTTYGDWKTTGEAFGPGPARGTLPGQMPVDGFQGKGLVNSFF